MDTKLLGIYLNDHLAGSVVGVELAKRAASNNEGTELGDFLAELAEDIEEDRDALKSVLDHFGVTENRVKMPIAWAAEKVGRLKPNGQITGYSPLSRLIELEGLALGVTGKLALWRSLAATQSDLGAFGLETLIARAESQQDGLEKWRIEAAREAFGAPVATAKA
ncbi:MAG: hypothetical protein QOI31_1363 [Solirubrobacterales bacterium]|jgi:hypothetical protein|nr:hypothetical protein [Solirubrobacterales bacterium]